MGGGGLDKRGWEPLKENDKRGSWWVGEGSEIRKKRVFYIIYWREVHFVSTLQ